MKTLLTLSFVFLSLSLFCQIVPPEAVDDFAETVAGIAVTIDPIANDVPNCADTLILATYPLAKKGKIIDRTDSTFTYVPFTNATGMDSIRYFVRDKSNIACHAEGHVFVEIADQHFYDSLTVNNINAGVNASGTMFSRMADLPPEGARGYIDPHFKYPKGENKNTIRTAALWIGGLDPDDSLHLAGQLYKWWGSDYQAGPVSDNYGGEHFRKYGRTWKLSRQEVEYHQDHYGVEGYEPIEPIANWPGNGDPGHGEAMRLAPFHDANSDGYYDPMDGDYPLIRGDQTVFFIFNDDMEHKETIGKRMNVEVHVMVYGYDAPEDTALCHTVFVHYDLVNRSEVTYHDTYVGLFADLELGYEYDDYVASDVERGTFYVYNGQEVDGYGEPGSYGENPPAQSVTVLAGAFMDPDGEDNPGGGCDESVNGLNFGNDIADDERFGLMSFVYFNSSGSSYPSYPQVAPEFYSYLQRLWRDSSPLMYGGNAHPSTGSVGPECKYMWPGDSDPLNWGTYCIPPNDGYNQDGKYWTELESGNMPFDRKGFGSMGRFTFAPGEVQEIELAFVVGQGSDGPMSSVEQMQRQIDSLIAGVHSGGVIVPNEYLAVAEHRNLVSAMTIYPNPASDIIHIKMSGTGFPEKSSFRIYNMQGQLVGEGEWGSGNDNAIHVADLVPGLYMLMVHAGQHMITGRFIKFQ